MLWRGRTFGSQSLPSARWLSWVSIDFCLFRISLSSSHFKQKGMPFTSRRVFVLQTEHGSIGPPVSAQMS
jgi:hypothetical protein